MAVPVKVLVSVDRFPVNRGISVLSCPGITKGSKIIWIH